MAEKSYVFNDTETTGLNTWFSQIIQIGSVLTDNEFNVEEELNLNSKVPLGCSYKRCVWDP